MRKLLARNSAKADADGLYSTRQITEALYGGLAEEKLATQRQLTKKYALENAITEASVLDRAALMQGLEAVAGAMVHRITTSKLDRTEQEDLLRELSSIPIVLEGVAARQSKLRRSKNGQAVEEDGSES